MWTIFKVFTECITILLLCFVCLFVLVWFSDYKVCGVSACGGSKCGIVIIPPALEGEVLAVDHQ